MQNAQINPQRQETDASEAQQRFDAGRHSEESRRYSDKEISALLKRAMELQQSGSSVPEMGRGITLADLQKIAAEVGIEPHHLQVAAAELEAEGGLGERFHLLGGPLSINLERIVEGEIPEEKWEALVEEIRRSLGQMGTPSKFGNSLEWTTKDEATMPVHVTVSPREGQTKIRIMSQFGGMAGAIHAPTLSIGVFVALLALTLPLPLFVNIGIYGGIVAGLFAGTRFVFGAWARKQKRKMKRLLDRLAALVTPPAPSATDEGDSSEKRLLPTKGE